MAIWAAPANKKASPGPLKGLSAAGPHLDVKALWSELEGFCRLEDEDDDEHEREEYGNRTKSTGGG
jgi:hypothetical protein